jgi:hypothetical protein
VLVTHPPLYLYVIVGSYNSIAVKLRGVDSNGMVLAAANVAGKDATTVELVAAPSDTPVGTRLTLSPATPNDLPDYNGAPELINIASNLMVTAYSCVCHPPHVCCIMMMQCHICICKRFHNQCICTIVAICS